MKKTILISIAVAWIVYFILPFEAPALSYFVAASVSPFLMKYIKPKYSLYMIATLVMLLFITQGYIIAGLLIGALLSVLSKTKFVKTYSQKIKLSENKTIIALVGVNAIVVLSVFTNKLLNGGF